MKSVLKLLGMFALTLGLVSLASCCGTPAPAAEKESVSAADFSELAEQMDDRFNFILGNDLGRNGYYDQKIIAQRMGEMAEQGDIEFVVAAGDTHHYDGVASVDDPLWLTNYELIYSHPELLLAWYPVLGNHEYRGNTQAVLDYGQRSRRWCMEGRYYTKTFKVDKECTMQVLFIDTTPLIDKYQEEAARKYPDVAAQSIEKQLQWIDSTLSASNATWKVVIGHHPIYAQTTKGEHERLDLQKRVDPLLRRHGVDLYLAGHIHNFQHIRPEGSPVDYVVNSSGSLSRPVSPIEGTLFCSPEPGFSVVSVSKQDLKIYMIDKEGKLLHTVVRTK